MQNECRRRGRYGPRPISFTHDLSRSNHHEVTVAARASRIDCCEDPCVSSSRSRAPTAWAAHRRVVRPARRSARCALCSPLILALPLACVALEAMPRHDRASTSSAKPAVGGDASNAAGVAAASLVVDDEKTLAVGGRGGRADGPHLVCRRAPALLVKLVPRRGCASRRRSARPPHGAGRRRGPEDRPLRRAGASEPGRVNQAFTLAMGLPPLAAERLHPTSYQLPR